MTLIDFLILLLIAGVCGAIGKSIAGATRGGLLATIAIGFIGALLGTWIARALSFPTLFVMSIGGTSFPIVWAILGSAIFVAVIVMMTRRQVV